MNHDIVEKCVSAIDEHNLDAIIAMSPENFAYAAGFVVPSQPVLRWRHAAAVVTSDGAVALLVVDMEASTVKDIEPETDLWVWEEFEDDAMPTLAALLREIGLDGARVGIETDYVPTRDMNRLSELLPDSQWVPCEAIFNRMRLIKTERELELMRHLARLTDASIREAFDSVGVGATEMDLAGAVTTNLFRNGAESFKWLILGSGERSQYPNVGPTMREFQRGDIVRLEVFGTLSGYNTGVCRTAVVQGASRRVEEIWENIAESRDLIFGGIRDGASGAAVYQEVKAKFESLGWEPMSFVGHGIGLFVHEEPYIGRYSDAEIKSGMVLGTEPVLLIPGQYGFQVKDIVAVGPSGCEILSDVTDTDRLLVIE